MPDEWREVTLGEVADTRNGAGIKQSFFSNTGIPLARVSNFTDWSIDMNDCIRVDLAHAKRWESHRLKQGDVVVATVGSWPPNWSSVVGKAVRVPCSAEGAIQNQNTCCVIARSGITDQCFLFYLMRTEAFGNYAANAAAGSANQARLPVANLERYPFILPPLSEQRAIAHILGTLDDKIELNRRMNETLEGMARALFKSWFVDFDPVRMKAEGGRTKSEERRAKSEKSPSGNSLHPSSLSLPPSLLDLFPDSFQPSELGQIPKGWTVATLGELSTLNAESWSKKTRPDIINYVDLSNTKWGRIEAVAAYEEGNAPSRAQRILRPRDTIVGTVRPGNGSYAFISEEGLTSSTGFAVLRPKSAEYAEFIYLAATASESIESLSHLADGGAYPAVRPEVVAAGNKAFMAFSGVTAPLLMKMAENERESRTLAALRDALLPKLISGELRVEDAAGFVGRVGV